MTEKNLSDICIWISECFEVKENYTVSWRVIMKYVQDYLTDNNLELTLKTIQANPELESKIKELEEKISEFQREQN